MTNNTIYNSLKAAGYKDYKKYDGEVGIEIETESKVTYDPPSFRYWNSHSDGSLRDYGIEYVLSGPVKRGKEIQEALTEWDDKVNKKFNLIKDSNTTSVHVHLNFLNNTWVDLVNFLTTYYLVENILIRLAGPDRLSNLFCLPICDAEGELTAITQMIAMIGTLQHGKLKVAPESYKYSALNICNLTRLGTMEVRSLEGTTDIKRIEDWVNLLLAIKDFAVNSGHTPPSIVELADQQGGEIIYPIFGDHVKHVTKVKDINNLIRKNIYFAAKIAGASNFKDKNWGFPKPKKIYKEKYISELDRIATSLFDTPYKSLVLAHKIIVDETLLQSLGERNLIFENSEVEIDE